MNISTYESRIAALEAQLGPGPGPGPKTGLVSIVFDPDIPLKTNKTINETLSEITPKESGTEMISAETKTFDEGDEYSFTITPGNEWYGVGVTSGGMGSGDRGKPYTAVAQVVKDADNNNLVLNIGAGAAATIPPEDQDSPLVQIMIIQTASN